MFLSTLLFILFDLSNLSNFSFSQAFVETMKSELESSSHPDEGSIERALPGVNRRFDGMEASIKAGFRKLEEKFHQQMAWRREQSDEGESDMKRKRLDLAVQLAQVAMEMCKDGGGESGGNGGGGVSLVVGGGIRHVGGSDDGGGGDGIGHDISSRKPRSVRQLYNEYFGLCEFVNVPVEAGLAGLERGGKNWRKHFTPADAKFFSRMTQVVEAVDRHHEETGAEVTDVLDEFDEMFAGRKKSLSSFIVYLQQEGFIPKRGRTSRLLPNGEGGGGFS